VLGVLLAFAGLELAMLVRDLTERRDLFVACLVAGVGIATRNLAIAIGIGFAASLLLRWARTEL
jgi:SulP family sulfate permease